MNSVDKGYFDLLRHILEFGTEKSDRTGTGTKSIFSYDMRFNMKEGFPLLTSKKMAWKSMVVELIWFLRGDTNIKYLVDNGCMIWVGDAYKNYQSKNAFATLSKEEYIEKIKTDDDFAKNWGDLGPVYGNQWRNWGGSKGLEPDFSQEIGYNTFGGGRIIEKSAPLIEVVRKGIDQISNLINDLKTNPDSRRLMVNAWNVNEIGRMVLPPCHYGFQCYTKELTLSERYRLYELKLGVLFAYAPPEQNLDDENIPKRSLSLKFNMRSVDVPLGLPFNVASYGLLLHLLAKEVNMIPEELIFSGGDVHIYLNQIDGIKQQLKQQTFDLPTIEIADKSIFDITYADIKLKNYKS